MKKCPYCSKEIEDDSIVCRYCGREVLDPEPLTTGANNTPSPATGSGLKNHSPAAGSKTNKMAVASLILGVISLLICLANYYTATNFYENIFSILLNTICLGTCFGSAGILAPIAGLITGGVAIGRRKQYTNQNLWMAISGIVTSVIGLVLNSLIIVWYAFLTFGLFAGA